MNGGAPHTRSRVDLPKLLADLRTESDRLDELVAGLADREWRRETPAPGWTIAHQISHLAWTDDRALLAATDDAGFRAEIDKALGDAGGYVQRGAEEGIHLSPQGLLRRWRTGRERLARALADVPEGTRLPWFGPPMSVASMATARLMETWAHGQDIADALGVQREATARLRHIARLGVRARDFAYLAHGLDAPAEQFRVELAGPDGQTWSFGPEEAEQRVSGPALDFCLLVTQRRHPADTAVRAVGEQAEHWLSIAQAFAGPPGAGRAKGRFA